MSRSRFRASALDPNDSFSFANVTVDGYSGEELNEGYQTGIVLKYGPTGATKLTLAAADGAITQSGTGLVSFNGNVHANNDMLVLGNFTVMGTTTEIDTDQMFVTDPITTLNASGSELLSQWSGLSIRDADGYNRIGWSFDGYWALSTAAVAGMDANPDRAIAFVGSTFTNGDLSVISSHAGSGAHKVGVFPTGNLISDNVQNALEELQGEIDALIPGSVTSAEGTTSLNWTIHKYDAPFTQESPCLIEHGGNGLGSELDGYLCTITDPTQPYRMQFKMYKDAVLIDPSVHIGVYGGVEDLNSSLVFNAGTGAAAKIASIKLWGTEDRLIYDATEHNFAGPVEMYNSLLVDGYLDAYGNVALGDSSSDTLYVGATIVSSLLPENNLHLLGDPTHRWMDGYFDFFVPTYYTPVGSNYSLEGHLKGIDAKLGTITNFTHGAYIITAGEAATDTLDSSRAVNQGIQADVGSLTDTQFLNNVYVYLDGQLLLNDTAKRANNGAVVNDVARDSATPSLLRFNRDVKKGAILQIVITM